MDFWDIDAMADAIYGILSYDALSDTFKKMGKAFHSINFVVKKKRMN